MGFRAERKATPSLGVLNRAAPPADATAALVGERPRGLGARGVSNREPRGLVGLGRAALDALLRCGILSAAQLAELLVGADALAHEAYGERVAAAVRALATVP